MSTDKIIGESRGILTVDIGIPALIFAGIGGVSSPLISLSSELFAGGEIPGLSYILGLFIYAFFGIVTCLLLAETNWRKAFFLGISVPAMIVSAANASFETSLTPTFQFDTSYPKPSLSIISEISLNNLSPKIIALALAEDNPSQNRQYFSPILTNKLNNSEFSQKQFELMFSYYSKVKNINNKPVVLFFSESGKKIGIEEINQDIQKILIPNYANYVVIQSGEAVSEPIRVFDQGKIISLLEIKEEPKFLSGFDRAMGNINAPQYNFYPKKIEYCDYNLCTYYKCDSKECD